MGQWASLKCLAKFPVKAVSVSWSPQKLLKIHHGEHGRPAEPLHNGPRLPHQEAAEGSPTSGANLPILPPASSRSESRAGAREVTGPRLRRALAGPEAEGAAGWSAAWPGAPDTCHPRVCSVGRERKQDAFCQALGVPGLGGQLLGLAASLRSCLLPSLYLAHSATWQAGNRLTSTLGNPGKRQAARLVCVEQTLLSCPGAPRQAPSTLEGERPPLAAPWAPPNVRPCTIHTPPLFSTTAKYLLEFWQDHLVTHSLPLRRREGRFKFIQGFSTAPFLLKSHERWVPRPFLQPEGVCSDETKRESFMVCETVSRPPAHLEPPTPCERSTMNSPILQVR